MDYSRSIEELKQASLFDLYRLQVAISHQLENPQRVQEIKSQLKPDQHITYFDTAENRLVEAKVIKLKRTRIFSKTWGGCRSDLLSDRTAVSKTALQSSSPPEY